MSSFVRVPSLVTLVGAMSLAIGLSTAVAAQDAPAEEAPKEAAAANPLAAFATLPADRAPKAITRDTHYWTGNEDNLQLFHPHVKDLGGIHVGVGTDQNYLLAGWAKSDVLVLMDFDQSIRDIHWVYWAMFANAETPAAFFELWEVKSRKKVRALLKETYVDKKQLRAAKKAYGTARWSVYRRLKKVRDQMAKLELPSFLTDDAQYAHVRSLVTGNKVFAVRGDLTAKKTLRAIGAAAKEAKLPVRVLYLSNAEQYFLYKRDFRKNIRALPLDDKSQVIRTSGLRQFRRVGGKTKDYYHYNVQSGPSLLAFVDDKKVRDAKSVLRVAPPTDTRGFSVLTDGPEEARAAHAVRLKEKKKAKKKAKRGKKGKSSRKTTKTKMKAKKKEKTAAPDAKAPPKKKAPKAKKAAAEVE